MLKTRSLVSLRWTLSFSTLPFSTLPFSTLSFFPSLLSPPPPLKEKSAPRDPVFVPPTDCAFSKDARACLKGSHFRFHLEMQIAAFSLRVSRVCIFPFPFLQKCRKRRKRGKTRRKAQKWHISHFLRNLVRNRPRIHVDGRRSKVPVGGIRLSEIGIRFVIASVCSERTRSVYFFSRGAFFKRANTENERIPGSRSWAYFWPVFAKVQKARQKRQNPQKSAEMQIACGSGVGKKLNQKNEASTWARGGRDSRAGGRPQ